MSNVLPSQIKRYFWGDNLSELSWSKHKKYIVATLLERGNTTALKWLFQQTNRNEMKELLPTLKLSPKSSNFWQIYLS